MQWEIISSISSAIIALAALVFSMFSFKRQQDRADAHGKATVKPLLSIKSQNFTDLKSIQLVNYGVGPAVIKKAEFRRSADSKPTNRIVDLFGLDIGAWEHFVNVPDNRAIPSDSEMILIKQSLTHLRNQGLSKDEGLEVLQNWRSQKTGILIHVRYEDIFGNEMEPLEETLK